MSFSSKALLSTFFAVLLMASVSTAGAQDSTSTPSPSPRAIKSPSNETFRSFSSSPKPLRSPGIRQIKERLTDQGLRACESREESIKKRGDNLTRMSANMLGKFDAIVMRVKEFYEEKVISSGKSVSNYDELLADISAKKSAVEAALSEVPQASEFDCSSDGPKALATDFREKMQAVKEALKEYRTSVKNLIVAVHSVLETSSPKPEPTP
jgi:hypothetical protein